MMHLVSSTACSLYRDLPAHWKAQWKPTQFFYRMRCQCRASKHCCWSYIDREYDSISLLCYHTHDDTRSGNELRDREKDLNFGKLLLETSEYFDAPLARFDGIRNLDNHRDLPPDDRLHLALRYRVRAWIKPAVTSLLMQFNPLTLMTRETAAALGGAACWIIRQGSSKIDKLSAYLAHNPPKLVLAAECPTFLDCSDAWEAEWWKGMAPHLLHPNRPARREAAMRIIQSISYIEGVCEYCLRDTKDSIARSNPWMDEQAIVDACVVQMLDLVTFRDGEEIGGL